MDITTVNTVNFGKIRIANQTVQRKINKYFSEDFNTAMAKNYQNNFKKADKSKRYDVIVDRYADVYIKDKTTGLRTKIKGLSSPFRNLSSALKTVIMMDKVNK